MSLEIRDLRAGYAAGEVLHGVSLTVEPGTVTALVGPTGAGKSTLLKVASGLLRPRGGPERGGKVIADGADLAGKSCAARVKAGIVMVPEGRQMLLESGTIADSGPDLLDRPERYFGVRGVLRGDGAPAMAAVLGPALGAGWR